MVIIVVLSVKENRNNSLEYKVNMIKVKML